MEPKVQNNGNCPNSTKPLNELSKKLETLKILAPLCAACRDAPQGEGLDLVAKCLADIPQQSLQVAIARYITESESRFFPAVGTLRRYAAESQEGVLPEWGLAWGRIMEATKVWCQFDRNKSESARAMVADLMEWVRFLGGFYTLANCDGDALTVLQSNFRNEWSKQKQRTETERRIPEVLRPAVRLPSPLKKNLESFGEMNRKLEGEAP